MAEHTPGPWRVSDGDELWVTGPNLNDNVICDLQPRDADCYTEEDEANARLIAAAPDLLTAAIYAARRADPYSEAFYRLARGVAAATGHDLAVVRRELGKAEVVNG